MTDKSYPPERERLMLEDQKLKRELEQNYEQQRLDIEIRKIEEETARQTGLRCHFKTGYSGKSLWKGDSLP